jgi:hypothetical protein
MIPSRATQQEGQAGRLCTKNRTFGSSALLARAGVTSSRQPCGRTYTVYDCRIDPLMNGYRRYWWQQRGAKAYRRQAGQRQFA